MITVKDIRDKEFTSVKHGYNADEVDDFLDEIADQMEELVRENRTMMSKVEEAQGDKARAQSALEEAKAVAAPATPAAPVPVQTVQTTAPAQADDSGYFKNLEAAVREALISAQRIADQTVAEAKRKAEKTVADAQAQAQSLRATAQEEADALRGSAVEEADKAKAEYEELVKKSEAYKARFKSIVEEQMKVLDTAQA